MSALQLAMLDYQLGEQRLTTFNVPSSSRFRDLVPYDDCVIAVFDASSVEVVTHELNQTLQKIGKSASRSYADELHELNIQPLADLMPVSIPAGVYGRGRMPVAVEQLGQGITAMIRLMSTQLSPEPDTITDNHAINPTPAPETGAAATSKAQQQGRARLRERIFSTGTWYTPQQVHEQNLALGGEPNAVYAQRLRKKGQLLGVWDGKRYLYPALQFDSASGACLPETKALLSTLPADPSGWKQAMWLYQPRRELNAVSAAQIFPKDPQRIIDLANQRFGGGDAHW